eukprot:3291393-Prymnesium_polylepis.2
MSMGRTSVVARPSCRVPLSSTIRRSAALAAFLNAVFTSADAGGGSAPSAPSSTGAVSSFTTRRCSA